MQKQLLCTTNSVFESLFRFQLIPAAC